MAMATTEDPAPLTAEAQRRLEQRRGRARIDVLEPLEGISSGGPRVPPILSQTLLASETTVDRAWLAQLPDRIALEDAIILIDALLVRAPQLAASFECAEDPATDALTVRVTTPPAPKPRKSKKGLTVFRLGLHPDCLRRLRAMMPWFVLDVPLVTVAMHGLASTGSQVSEQALGRVAMEIGVETLWRRYFPSPLLRRKRTAAGVAVPLRRESPARTASHTPDPRHGAATPPPSD